MGVTPASYPSALTADLPLKNKFAEALGNMEIRSRRSCWLPRRVKARLGSSFNAVEIDSPGSRRIETRRQTPHGQCHLCPPGVVLLIDLDAPRQSALQIAPFPSRDVQVNPKTVRAHFKLFVVQRLGSCRLQENLSDVAVPEVIPPSAGLGVGENREAAIVREKSQVENIASPQQPHLCLSAWIRVLPLPVAVELYP